MLIASAAPRIYEFRTPWTELGRRIRAIAAERGIVNWDDVFDRLLMAITVPQASRSLALKNFLNNTAPQTPVLRLYTSNTTPSDTDIASTFTEMSTQGYAPITLTAGSWAFTNGAPSHADFAQQTVTADGTGGSTSVYGYFWTQTSSGLLMIAERFSDGPYILLNSGDAIKISPYLGESQA